MTDIVINPDQTVSAVWKGKKGRGSLFQTMAVGNAENANKLNIVQIMAVMFAARKVPFPFGDGEKVYRECLKIVDEKKAEISDKVTLGALRQQIVGEGGSGCGAPHDTYLDIAAAVVENKPVKSR